VMRHVPGNHEWRWDPTARERYHELLGATRYSFDAEGIRFIALNPSHLLQEGGGFGEHGMAWLVDQLDQVPSDVPVILMCHFPFGYDNYYVSDQQRLLEVLRSYNVRAVLAGHIHNEQVHRFGVGGGQRLDPVMCRSDLVALQFQGAFEGVPDGTVVIGDEHAIR
jgi:3',5'-cyclic AMP phosphodiesterase CpdA